MKKGQGVYRDMERQRRRSLFTYALYYSYSPLLTPPPASSSVWACAPSGFLSTASEPHMLERQPGQPGIGVLVVVVVMVVVVL
ncbi:unnamed protein product [Boreogadus saida]